MQKIAIYGAKSLALGIYEAIHFLYPQYNCIGFVVSSLKNNPNTLAGLKVWELDELKARILPAEREAVEIVIATPEDIHEEITDYLLKNGFKKYICMDSHREAALMEQYYIKKGGFQSLHFPASGTARLCVYQAKFFMDKPLKQKYEFPEWIVPLQVGAALTTDRVCELCDNQGVHISAKNVNYCELTALYWMWKNRLSLNEKPREGFDSEKKEYYGLFHYRRILDISDRDLFRIKYSEVDAILPFPTLCEPDIKEHHSRYIKESDWNAMLKALKELQPSYAAAYEEIFSQQYFYNYNMLIARKHVLKDYCSWLFPILERTEELSTPKGWERADRYIGYLGESLMTLYFLFHKDDLNIVHTGRLMLT